MVGELVFRNRIQGFIVTRLLNDIPVLIIRLHKGIHTIGNLHGIIVSIVVAHPRKVEVDTCLHIFVDGGINRALQVDTLLLISDIYTFVLVESHAEVVSHMLARTIDRHVVVLLETGAGNEVHPVGGLAFLHQFFETILPCILLSAFRLPIVVTSHLLIACHVINRLSAGCNAGTAGISQELEETIVVKLLCVHEHIHTGRTDSSHIHIITDGRFLFFLPLSGAGLGGNLYHTCRRARTIYSCAGCVFKHINSGNVLRVEPINVIAYDTIHYIDRLGVGVGG